MAGEANADKTVLLKLLPLAGALPFIFSAGLLLFDVQILPVLGAVAPLVLAYGLAILSFMAGVHWGQFISGNGKPWLLVTSNAVTVLAWLGYILSKPALFAGLLALLFSVLLLIDYRLTNSHIIDRSYFRTRTIVTSLVVASLMIIGILIA